MKRTYDYVLRYSVQPGCCEEERLNAVVDFCKASHTPEVMFFVQPEELNTGHTTLEELDEWMKVVKEGQRRLKEIGVRTSINPWMTTLHCDRGRRLKPGQNFRLMVDPKGRQATACACPLNEAWLDNLCACYAKYAEIAPEVLWIEDDFRLHNHSPLFWGGCFCEEHMKAYSALAGKTLTREEFVAGVCGKGEVHPYRKIWLDVSRKTILHMAERIAKAVFAVNPDVRLGLMTSDPAVHCAEARDWHSLMDKMTGNKRPHVRIHLPAYSEITSQAYGINFQYVSRLTKALLPGDIEIYPELENFPDTRFTKSCAFSRFQIEMSAQLGAAGVTMNIYDMMGNGVLKGEKYQNMLAEIRPFMDMTRELEIDKAENAGVEVLVNPSASYTLESANDESPAGLYPRERTFAGLLTAFSIANRYRIGKPSCGAIAAVSGQYFSALSDAEIKELIDRHTLIMDGEAVLQLKKRGLLHLIGAKDARVIPAENGEASYEEVANGRTYAGIARARLTMQGATGDFVAIEYDEGVSVEVMTEAHAPEGGVAAPAMAVIGSKTLILPYAGYPQDWGTHKMTIRCELIQDAIERMTTPTPTYAKDAPYVHVYEYAAPGRTVIALVNTAGDDCDEVELRLGDHIKENAKLTLWSKDALMGRDAQTKGEGREICLKESIRRLETLFLTIE